MWAQLLLPAMLLLWGSALVLYLRSVGPYWWWASASNLSVVHASILLWGTWFVCGQRGGGESVDWCYLLLMGVVAMLLGMTAGSLRKGVHTRQLAEAFYRRPLEAKMRKRTLALLAVIMAVGVAVVVLFLQRLEGNVLLEVSRWGVAEVSPEEMVALRKQSVYGAGGYQSDQYMAPGYVAQFRARLLPVIAACCLLSLMVDRRRRVWLGGMLLVAVVAFTIANGATGQRQAMVEPFALIGYLCLVRYYCAPAYLPPRARVLLRGLGVGAIVAAVGLFGLLTLALGRAPIEPGEGGRIQGALSAVFNRVVVIPAETDLGSVEVLRGYPCATGRGWARGMLMPLPNSWEQEITRDWSPVGTPTWLHVEHGGSQEGNAPLTRWGSLWFNFRLPGMLLLGFLAGYLTQCYDRWCFQWRKTPMGVVCWQVGAVSISLATTPIDLVLTGLAAALILMGLNRLLTGRVARASAPPPVARGTSR